MHVVLLLLLMHLFTTAPSAPLLPQLSTPRFQLISSSPSAPFSNLKLSIYHIYPGGDYAVLVTPTTADPGLLGYLNGTVADFRTRQTTFVVPAGSFDEGLVISRINASYNLVEVNAGVGTKGIYLAKGGTLEVNAEGSAGFYACESQLPFGAAVQVFYRVVGEAVPVGCALVDLQAAFQETS